MKRPITATIDTALDGANGNPKPLLVVTVEAIEPCAMCGKPALVYPNKGMVYRACPECGHIELKTVRVQMRMNLDVKL